MSSTSGEASAQDIPTSSRAATIQAPRPTTETTTIVQETSVDKLAGFALVGVVICACVFLLLAAFAANLAAPAQPGMAAAPAQPAGAAQRFLLGLIARDTAAVSWYLTNLVRGAEVLSTIIAALMVFLIIRARQGDALMTLLGLIVIAALIVPTNELIRLTESARGTAENPRDPPRTSIVSIASPDASVLVAQRVIQDLLFEQLLTTEARTNQPERLVAQDARRFRDALGVALYRVEIGSIANTIRQRNLDRLLLELTVPESRTNLLLSPSTSRQARDDIGLLRDLGVVSHLYGSMAQLEVSELGLRVLHRLYPENANVRSIAESRRLQLFSSVERVADQAAVVRAAVPVTAPVGLMSSAVEVRTARDLPWRRQFTITQGLGQGLRLEVEAEIEVVVEARGLRQFDPLIRVWDMANREPRNVLAEMDDTGSGVDALLLRTFAPGTYLIQVQGFASSTGGVSVAVRRSTEADREGPAWTQGRDAILPAGTEDLALPEASAAVQVSIPQNGIAARRIVVEEPASLRFQTRTDRDTADPQLQLWRLGSVDAQQIAADDDGAGGLDARIEATLAPGEYVLQVQNLQGRAAEVTLIIERTTARPAETPAAPAPREAPARPPPTQPAPAAPGRAPAPR